MPLDPNPDRFEDICSVGEMSTLEHFWFLLLPFEDQQWYHHALLVGGGLVLWWGTFALTTVFTGELSVVAAETAAGLEARRQGVIAASLVSSTLFAVAWVYGYGGLVLSLFGYPTFVFLLINIFMFPYGFGTHSHPFVSRESVRLTPRFNIEYFPIIFAMLLPFLIIAIVAVFYNRESDHKFATFVEQWSDVQIRVLFPIQPEMSPELKRVIREAHRSSTDGQNDDDARANS